MKEHDNGGSLPEDVTRYLAAERGLRLGALAEKILNAGGSHESLELVRELIMKMAVSTRRVYGFGNGRRIRAEDIDAAVEGDMRDGDNPFPRLTLAESHELVGLMSRSKSGLSPAERERFTLLQRKALGLS